jgi:hypothetical protein
MTKVVLSKLPTKAKSGKDVPVKRVRREDGSIVQFSLVDADSPDFGEEFRVAFERNVKRARRENRALSRSSRVAAE